MRTASLKEWIGRTDDDRIPDYVRVRVMRKAGDRCVKCTRSIDEKLKGEIDHAIALILGGKHRESNLQLLCTECHKGKTKLDVRIKAKASKSRLRNLAGGRRRKARPMPGTFASGIKHKMDGTWERRS